MEQKFQESAARFMATEQGRQLMQALSTIPPEVQGAIRDAVSAGNAEKAKALLAPWMQEAGNRALLQGLFGGASLG